MGRIPPPVNVEGGMGRGGGSCVTVEGRKYSSAGVAHVREIGSQERFPGDSAVLMWRF